MFERTVGRVAYAVIRAPDVRAIRVGD